jgi:hypothetical protein
VDNGEETLPRVQNWRRKPGVEDQDTWSVSTIKNCFVKCLQLSGVEESVTADNMEDTEEEEEDDLRTVVFGKFQGHPAYQKLFQELPIANSVLDLQEPAKVPRVSYLWRKDIPEEIHPPMYQPSSRSEEIIRNQAKELIEGTFIA